MDFVQEGNDDSFIDLSGYDDDLDEEVEDEEEKDFER